MTAKSRTECSIKGRCHYESLTRTKFFHGMLLTDEHLRAEQTYHRETLKRLNRHLWGAGIVCGLEVTEPKTGLCIKVHPGAALDCHGNLIEVCKTITLDLSELCKKAYPDGCASDDAEVKPITKYLVIRYDEIPDDRQPVLTPDDDCTPTADGIKCEDSKYREGFCLEFRDTCPDCLPCSDEEKGGKKGLVTYLLSVPQSPVEGWSKQYEDCEKQRPKCTESPPCCDCHCDDGAVGLAKLVIDCVNNKVKVECDECRQYVWSPRMLRWLACKLIAGIEGVDTGVSDLSYPTANAVVSNPLRAAWDVGGILLKSRRVNELYEAIRAQGERLATLEATLERQTAGDKSPAPRGKSKQSE